MVIDGTSLAAFTRLSRGLLDRAFYARVARRTTTQSPFKTGLPSRASAMTLKPVIPSTLKRANGQPRSTDPALKALGYQPAGKPSEDGWRQGGINAFSSKYFVFVFFWLVSARETLVGPYQPSMVLSAVTAFFS